MNDPIELSSDTDIYCDDRENLDDELSAILKKYENFGSNYDGLVQNAQINLKADYADLHSDTENKISSPKKRRVNNDLSSNSSENESNIQSPQENLEKDIPKTKGKHKLTDIDKIMKKLEREEKLKQKNEEKSQKLVERLKKKEELEKAKSEKRVMNEIYKSLKPEEALKQVKCILDRRISEEIALGIKEVEISVKQNDFESKFPKVTWDRNVQMKLIGSDGQLGMGLEKEKIPVLFIIKHEELLNLARTDNILSLAIDGKSQELITLVELDPNKLQRGEEKIIESSLTELQIVSGWSHRKLKSNTDFIELIRQYSKSFALAPSKRLKAANIGQITQPPSTDCVRVQNNTGHGLSALYLRQLSQFPLASLETAHAVCKLYPTPKSLINARDNQEVIDTLADSQVRRAVGPLSAPRRLGPQLSKKIHVAFTSRDPDAILS